MRVGTRIACEKINQMFEDHPHACGDKSLKKARYQREQGSSPCVWGQVFILGGNIIMTRIIPMRVGTRAFVLGATLLP